MTNEDLDATNSATNLTLVAKLCDGGGCPTVFRTERGTLIIQGYQVSAESAGIVLPAGEQVVEIPAELLTAALRHAGNIEYS